ncbi:hypothetical protein [Lishizhenia sp.]|uniref:hypothetical protein n=1 Tax=Lishizhenia sp. TaxID=2497594 RepID=UPI00299F3AB6|nr:hypothetical protein [Lishizhenia sp.]
MTHVKKSYSILELSRLLGIKRYRTVWYLSMKIRMAMGDEVLAKEYFLFLTLLSKDKCHPSQLKAIQNYSITAIFKSPANCRDEINLIAPLKIQQNVNTVEHSLIKSGYRCLKIFNAQKKIEMKEPHFPVKTKIKNWLNYIMSNENRNLNGIHHGVSFLHLQKYLFEYSFNYNLRYQNKFKILMKRVLS